MSGMLVGCVLSVIPSVCLWNVDSHVGNGAVDPMSRGQELCAENGCAWCGAQLCASGCRDLSWTVLLQGWRPGLRSSVLLCRQRQRHSLHSSFIPSLGTMLPAQIFLAHAS